MVTAEAIKTEPCRLAWLNFLQGKWSVPVKVTPVAARCGYGVVTMPLKKQNGFFVNPTKTIYVNAHHPPVRRRFSVAHEIGHIELGHSLSDDAATRQRHERDANMYGAGLLMPAPFMKHAWACLKCIGESYGVPVGEWTVEMLARHFWVSRPAARIRMRCLNLL
jgi:Zn-dependent peptidase ImmA (M78 family)